MPSSSPVKSMDIFSEKKNLYVHKEKYIGVQEKLITVYRSSPHGHSGSLDPEIRTLTGSQFPAAMNILYKYLLIPLGQLSRHGTAGAKISIFYQEKALPLH